MTKKEMLKKLIESNAFLGDFCPAELGLKNNKEICTQRAKKTKWTGDLEPEEFCEKCWESAI